MEKIDFKKKFKSYYSPKPGKPEIVMVPKMQFAMVDGRGDPNDSKEFQNAISALYSVVFGLKFSRKKAGREPDFSCGALEGLWWSDRGKPFEIGSKQDWLWTLMIWLPDFITSDEFRECVEATKLKKANPGLDKIHLGIREEELAVQIMHVGPYADEQPNVDKMLAYAAEKGYVQSGKHHEIYLGDPRRIEPDKLKTILRHPIDEGGVS